MAVMERWFRRYSARVFVELVILAIIIVSFFVSPFFYGVSSVTYLSYRFLKLLFEGW